MNATRIAQRVAVPAPESRITPETYAALRAWMLANDPDAQPLIEWSRQTSPPATAQALAREVIWIILCAGRSAQAARTIETRVLGALTDGKAVVSAFGYRAKAAAIERAWYGRDAYFAGLRTVLATNSPEQLVDWCAEFDFVGDDTKFQLAKNLGADVCKPDIWLCRLAGVADKPRRSVNIRFPACMVLCRSLAAASGDRVGTVDTVLWLACNKGVLVVDQEAGPVTFAPRTITRATVVA
jgi:hypothetical protein